MDLRHRPTEDDRLMCEWLKHLGKPFFVVATKADKVSRGQWARHLKGNPRRSRRGSHSVFRRNAPWCR